MPQASYGKGTDYYLLTTAIFPISVFLSDLSAWHSALSWEIISMTVLYQIDSYLSLLITAHAQNKIFFH